MCITRQPFYDRNQLFPNQTIFPRNNQSSFPVLPNFQFSMNQPLRNRENMIQATSPFFQSLPTNINFHNQQLTNRGALSSRNIEIKTTDSILGSSTSYCYSQNQQFTNQNVITSFGNSRRESMSSFYQSSSNVFQCQEATRLDRYPTNNGRFEFCGFCRKNGEPPQVYESHTIKTPDGKILCPILRRHICDLCGATGDYAHTRTHCPKFDKENVQPKPNFRIMSNGKCSKMVHHK